MTAGQAGAVGAGAGHACGPQGPPRADRQEGHQPLPRIAWQTRGSGKNRAKARVLVPAGSMEGRGPATSFPYPVFESCVLQCLAEVKAEDIYGEQPASESAKLIAQRDSLERRLNGEVAGEQSRRVRGRGLRRRCWSRSFRRRCWSRSFRV